MANDDDWITTRNSEAGKRHPLVPEAVAAQMDALLRGQLSSGQLTAMDLAGIARQLIAGMAPAQPTVEAKP
jgi:hypothetical protein